MGMPPSHCLHKRLASIPYFAENRYTVVDR